jgi:hypothetical protein
MNNNSADASAEDEEPAVEAEVGDVWRELLQQRGQSALARCAGWRRVIPCQGRPRWRDAAWGARDGDSEENHSGLIFQSLETG